MKATILSMDGGGIKSIISTKILAYLESLLKNDSENQSITDYFDFIAGTDTGGLVSLMLCVRDENKRPKFTANEVFEFILHKGSDIYDKSMWKKLSSLGGASDEVYSSNSLDKILNNVFQEKKLNDVVVPVMVTAYDLRNKCAKIFNTTDASKGPRNFALKDICRATMAIPSFFEPARIISESQTPYSLASGVLIANNPSLVALTESSKMDFKSLTDNENKPSYPSVNDIVVISIGTGNNKIPYYHDDSKDWGYLQWMKPVMDIAMSGNSEMVDYQLKQIFKTNNAEENYFRLQPEFIDLEMKLDNTNSKNINMMLEMADKFISNNKEKLDNIAQILIAINKE